MRWRALGPLRPLRGSRAPSCDFASQSSSLRSSGDLTASPQVHLALRQPASPVAPPPPPLAGAAADGKPIPAPNAVPQTFNSAEMIEMHRNLSAVTLAEVDAKVKFPTDSARLPEEYRSKVPPSPKEFRAIVADLFLNEDTWAFDAQAGATPGDRIRKLMISYSHELRFVFGDIAGFVKCLDEPIREKVSEILVKLRDIPADSLRPDAQGNVAPGTMNALAEAKPAAAKDFAAVDRKADKFDLSLGALKNFFKGDDGDM